MANTRMFALRGQFISSQPPPLLPLSFCSFHRTSVNRPAPLLRFSYLNRFKSILISLRVPSTTLPNLFVQAILTPRTNPTSVRLRQTKPQLPSPHSAWGTRTTHASERFWRVIRLRTWARFRNAANTLTFTPSPITPPLIPRTP